MQAPLRRILAALGIALMATAMFPSFAPAAASTTPSKATALTVTAQPARLPADGKTYSSITVGLQDASGNPSLALAPVKVYLSSSATAVATVPGSTVIPPGRDFVIVNVTTTQNAGVTDVVASASGLVSGGASITTMAPSGFATKLAVTANPGTVLEGSSGSLTIQLEDATGAVARASSNVVVTLTSANNQSVTVATGKMTIPAGWEMGVANYTTGFLAGEVTVTASSPGFIAGTSQVTVFASSPIGIVVSAEPSEVVEGGPGRVVIWLANSLGFPAVAAQPVSVSLTSSNLGVLGLFQDSVVIPQGQFAATVNFTSGSSEGESTITASAQGLASGFGYVSSYPAAREATALQLFVAPSPTLADGGSFRSVLVGITNQSGFPTTAPGNTRVNITSSNTAVGSVTESIVISSGAEFGTALFSSEFLVGTTVITASAQNLASAQAQASTFGPVPVGLSLGLSASSLPANGIRTDDVSVSLTDVNGHPAVAPSNIQLELTSSKPNVASLPSTLTIAAGQSYALVPVQAGITVGVTTLTVTAPGYGSSSSQLTTTAPAPSRLALYTVPPTALNSTITSDGAVLVQLQDANGFPADAVQPTTVTITSSNSTVLNGPLTLSFIPGTDLMSASVSTSEAGSTNMTATSPGLSSASSKLTALVSPITLTLAPAFPLVYNNETLAVTLTLTALGAGVANASVVWHTNLGTLNPTKSNTSAAGVAQTLLFSPATGAATILATVTSPLIGTVNVTTVTSVVLAPPKPSVSPLAGLAHALVYIILVVVIVLLVVAFLLVRRRRAKRREALGAEGAEDEFGPGTEEGSPFEEGTTDDLGPPGPP